MNEQEKREKVIYELGTSLSTGVLPKEIGREAIALLKAQEPRVMTLEEVQKLQRNDVVWLDERAGKQVIPVFVRRRYIWPCSTVMVIDFLDSYGCTITVSEVDLLFRDRCWTSRPTEAQREAVPWPDA